MHSVCCDLQVKTSFKEFATVVCDDPRSATLDAGNVKLTYNALIEKVSEVLVKFGLKCA